MATSGNELGAPAAKPRLLTANYLIITLVGFVNASNFYLLTVISSGYVQDVFKADAAAGGLAAGIFVIGALLSRAVCGRMLGLLGYRKSLVIGLFIALAASASYCMALSPESFMLVRTVHGFGFGIIVSAASTIVADIIPKERTGEGMGYFQLSATVATAIGPLVAVQLSMAGNYTAIFLVCTGLLAVCLVLSIFLRLQRIVLSEADRAIYKGFRLASFLEAPVFPVSSIAMLLYLSYGGIVAFLALFTREQGIPEYTSLFFITYAIVIVASRPLVSRIFDRKGVMVILAPALAILTCGFIVLSFMDSLLVLILAGVLVGLGQGATQVVTMSQAAKITPVARKGVATTTYFLFTDIGYSAGPILSGLMLAFISYQGLYIVMGAVIAAALAGSLVFRKSVGSGGAGA